jgi:hypothetical protein
MASDDNDLAQLLESEGFRLRRGTTLQAVLRRAPRRAAVLLLGDGTRQMQRLSADDLRLIEEKQLRVFADFAAMPGEEPEQRVVNFERVVVAQPLGELKPMDLLTVKRARFIVGRAVRPLMYIARVAGFDYAPFGLTDTELDSGNARNDADEHQLLGTHPRPGEIDGHSTKPMYSE